MCTMMQVQGSNMMDMGGNSAAAFWGARHASWPATSHAHSVAGGAAANQDPKVAEKLMTELQVRQLLENRHSFSLFFSLLDLFHFCDRYRVKTHIQGL